MASAALIQAVAVTAELCGRTMSPEAAAVFVSDLDGYDEGQVMQSLTRCRKEVRGLLTINDVIRRLADGRPDADEAYASLPWDDSASTVWTDEIRVAFFTALPAHEAGDRVGARIAFKTAYERLVAEARERRQPPIWYPSLGYDAAGRESVLLQAVERGRLSTDYVAGLLPHLGELPKALKHVAENMKRIGRVA